MELIDKKQVEAFKRLGRRLGGDPARLRVTLCVALAGAGILGVERPLGLRLAGARSAHVEARKTAQMAEEVAYFTRERAGYEARVAVPADVADWQNYVLDRLRCTTATLVSFEPRKPLAKGVFTVLELELVAKGSSYREFVDFIDRLERGERLVRVEKLRLEKQQDAIHLTCLIRGLVKGSAKSAKPAASGAAPLAADVFVGPRLPDDAPEPDAAEDTTGDADGEDAAGEEARGD
ncbi:MAG TPA: hypothetical protein VFD43_11875 [Planctomycetota bacterium]|nr:hypothetical protein [Planctomycetota bacterium]